MDYVVHPTLSVVVLSLAVAELLSAHSRTITENGYEDTAFGVLPDVNLVVAFGQAPKPLSHSTNGVLVLERAHRWVVWCGW